MNIRRFADTGEWTTRRYLALLGNILIWAIVAIDAFYLWPTQLHGSTSMVIVSGHSMEPTYFTGDLVIARKDEPSVGDVIVYAPAGLGGSQIVHRIIGGNAIDGWQMQGDNNNFVDPFTPKGSEVKGVVMVHYANFGRVSVLLLNPIVWAFVLLIAIVLLVWWSGDTCEDDRDDEDGNDDANNPESETEDQPDLIDRIVEGTEAAVARMVASGAAAGATALAMVTRPSPSPRHAARSASHAAPAYLRGSAIVAVLGLLAIFGPSTASASQLIVNTAGEASVKSLQKCGTQNLAVTPSGTPTGSAYSQVTVSGIVATCAGKPITVYMHNAAGTVIATFTGTTPATGSTMTLSLTPSGTTFVASQVNKVVVKVNGWLFLSTWSYTPPTPADPPPFGCDGLLMSNGQPVTGTNCTLSGTVQYSYLDQYNGGNPYWGTPIYYGTVSANIAFNPGGYQSGSGWVQYQNITLWRYTIDLTTMGGSAQYMNSLSNGFYLYKSDNTVLAPGEDCSDPTAVTFQEAVAGSSPSSGFVVSPRPIAWMPASSLLCHG